MKNKGFSLVELIVVIAIMAILVGVAVPVYTSYIEKASISSDKQMVGEVVHSIEIANAMAPFKGSATIILTKDGVTVNGVDADKAWVEKVLGDTFGEKYYEELKLKYNGWGNGVVAANAMLGIFEGKDYSDELEALLGDPDNLSFTEDIPALLEEVKQVSIKVTKEDDPTVSDATTIATVNKAAELTAGWDLEIFKELWSTNIKYQKNAEGKNEYTHNVSGAAFPADADFNQKKLTIAAIVRAKNTCVVLHAKNNEPALFAKYPNLYTALTEFTAQGSKTMPADLQDPGELSNISAMLTGMNVEQADQEKLVYWLTDYQNNAPKDNDAAAYFAMMCTVHEVDADNALNENSIDEYFNSVSGPVKLFQQLVAGTIELESLQACLPDGAAATNNVTISIVGDGQDLVIVVGPTSVLE